MSFSSHGLGSYVPFRIDPGAGSDFPGVIASIPSTPPASPIIAGLAGTLKIANILATAPLRLRDGVNVNYNSTAAGSYAGRLNELFNGIAAARTFANGTGADPTGSVGDFAASSISWMQAFRQNALAETEYKTTFLQNTQTALSNATGVNMDEQLTHLTEIQRSYQASAKLITTIDEMLKTLLASI